MNSANTTTEDVLNGVDLSAKVAVVTGASGGLGLETARAATSVWAATAPELAQHGGTYLADGALSTDHASWATDAAAARQLWTLSEQLVGETFAL